jgi:hypothetical protein
MSLAPRPSPRWFALPLLALGVAGFAAAWLLVALGGAGMVAWLAPLAGLDMVLLLGLARWPAGASRAGWAVLATAATIALANFCIVAAQLGQTLGLGPVESALRMGPAYAWLLAGMANRPADLALYAAGLLAAGWAGFSARRPAPSAR